MAGTHARPHASPRPWQLGRQPAERQGADKGRPRPRQAEEDVDVDERGRPIRGDDDGDADLFEHDEGMYAFEGEQLSAEDDEFFGLNMREIYQNVIEGQRLFPMRIPKPKGLARILQPELANGPPQYDHKYPWGLQPFDFAPDGSTLEKPGEYRYSEVDRLLSHHEEEAQICLQPLGPLSTVDEWLDALTLPEDARMRRNPRFIRILEAYCDNVKFKPQEKTVMLASLMSGLAADPKAAGYKDGKLPFEVPTFMFDSSPGSWGWGVRRERDGPVDQLRRQGDEAAGAHNTDAQDYEERRVREVV